MNTMYELSIAASGRVNQKPNKLEGSSEATLRKELYKLSLKGVGHRAKRIAVAATKSECCNGALRLISMLRAAHIHGTAIVAPVYGRGAAAQADSLIFQA